MMNMSNLSKPKFLKLLHRFNGLFSRST